MTTVYSRRRLLQLLGAGVGAAGLAGCAPSAPEDSRPSAGGSPAGDSTDFSFASWSLSEEAAAPVVQAQLDAYAGAHGIAIDGVTYPFNEYLNQLVLQIRGGQFSGAAQLDVAWLGVVAPLGALRDVGAVVSGGGYTDTAVRAGQVDDAQWGVPWTIGAIGLVTNAELLGRVGATTAPETIEDFEALLTELKALGAGIVPYAAMTKPAQMKDILTWMETFGSPLIDGDTVTIGDEPSVEAVAWFKRLYDAGLIAPDVDRFDARALFGQGKVGIYDDAVKGTAATIADSPDPELAAKLDGIARPVLAAGDSPRSLLWGHVIVVVDGDGADTATDYAHWVTSDEGTVVRYFEDILAPPALEAAADAPEVTAHALTAAFNERVTPTATASPFWRFPQYAQMEIAVAERVQSVLVGDSSPADAMRAAGEAVQALI